MKKNLLNEAAANEIIARANKLQPAQKSLWGSMTASEMLHHCNFAIKATLTGKADNAASTFKQKILKFLFLYVVSKFPKNVRAPKKIDIKRSNLSPALFEVELEEFIQLIKTFSTTPQTIEATHPIFGKLTNRQWGVFTWMHMDHHLRQFAV